MQSLVDFTAKKIREFQQTFSTFYGGSDWATFEPKLLFVFFEVLDAFESQRFEYLHLIKLLEGSNGADSTED